MFTVLGYGTYCIEADLAQVKVVVFHKSHLISVRRKRGNHLFATVGNSSDLFSFDVYQVVIGSKRVTVYPLFVSVNQGHCLIIIEIIPLNAFYRTLLDLLQINNSINQLACGIFIFKDCFPFLKSGVMQPVIHRLQAIDTTCIKSVIPENVVKRDILFVFLGKA